MSLSSNNHRHTYSLANALPLSRSVGSHSFLCTSSSIFCSPFEHFMNRKLNISYLFLNEKRKTKREKERDATLTSTRAISSSFTAFILFGSVVSTSFLLAAWHSRTCLVAWDCTRQQHPVMELFLQSVLKMCHDDSIVDILVTSRLSCNAWNSHCLKLFSRLISWFRCFINFLSFEKAPTFAVLSQTLVTQQKFRKSLRNHRIKSWLQPL